jgi:glycosyltransferase involved in cell wall biosynthesis
MLAEMLDSEGHEVEVIHCRDTFGSLADREWIAAAEREIAVNTRVTVHGLESGMGMLSPAATFFSGRPILKDKKIESILDRGRFDVIHFHNISLVGGPAVLGLGRAIKLLTLHEHWLICPTHTLFKFGERACDGRQCLRCAIQSGRPPQPWRYTSLVQRSLNHVDAVLCPSRSVQRKHEEAGIRARYVRMPSFSPLGDESGCAGKAATARAHPYFLFAGRLEKLKGLQEVVPLFANGFGADLLVAGAGGFEPELRELARGSAAVQFLGQVEHSRLKELYAGAVALLIPSITYEVMPLAMVEAMHQGTPVIARNLGPLPELVEESCGGVIFSTGRELRDHIHMLLADTDLRNRLGEAGRRHARSEWSAAAYQERYTKLIETIREEKARRGV